MRPAILTTLFTLAAAWGVIAQDRDGPPPHDAARPAIVVKASPLLAFAPARIAVHAELKGGALDYEPYYCTTIVWDWGDETTSELTPDCSPYEAGTSRIRRHHTSVHTYASSGHFTVRFQMKRGDRIVGSASKSVLVRPPVRNPGEVADQAGQ
jgi:hypothetical protein